MEKVYIRTENKAPQNKQWRNEDTSPYDFSESVMQETAPEFITLDHYDADEDDFEENTLYPDLGDEFDDLEEMDMYSNNNINVQPTECKPKTVVLEKKIITEEENPKRTTTTWIKVTKTYE